jgi:hypothetical protein
MPENKYFMYKGRPVVRSGNLIYYGYIANEYVIKIQIMKSKKENGVDIPTKLMVMESTTANEKTDPFGSITRRIERDSLFDALDFANSWLKSHNL